jgi:hypothetical protein
MTREKINDVFYPCIYIKNIISKNIKLDYIPCIDIVLQKQRYTDLLEYQNISAKKLYVMY